MTNTNASSTIAGIALIGLGANLGDARATIDRALDRIASHLGTIERVSELRETRPVGGPANQPPYLNGAALVRTSFCPEGTLEALLRIEAELGRTRTNRWGPRTIDLDLLLQGDDVIESARLVLPHACMTARPFVMVPAIEIASGMRFPLNRWKLAEIGKHLASSPRVAWLLASKKEADHWGPLLASTLSGDYVSGVRPPSPEPRLSFGAWRIATRPSHDRGTPLARIAVVPPGEHDENDPWKNPAIRSNRNPPVVKLVAGNEEQALQDWKALALACEAFETALFRGGNVRESL